MSNNVKSVKNTPKSKRSNKDNSNSNSNSIQHDLEQNLKQDLAQDLEQELEKILGQALEQGPDKNLAPDLEPAPEQDIKINNSLNISKNNLKQIIEAILLAANKPVSEKEFLEMFREDEVPSIAQLRTAIAELKKDCETRGVELLDVASGIQMQIKPTFAPYISKLWEEKPVKYSRALLETLALIAYRQPITRGEIEEIRGVGISVSIFKTLMEERGWIRIVGHREVPGRPGLYATTKQFLDYFGLKKLDQLPSLQAVMDLAKANLELDFNTTDTAATDAKNSDGSVDTQSSDLFTEIKQDAEQDTGQNTEPDTAQNAAQCIDTDSIDNTSIDNTNLSGENDENSDHLDNADPFDDADHLDDAAPFDDADHLDDEEDQTNILLNERNDEADLEDDELLAEEATSINNEYHDNDAKDDAKLHEDNDNHTESKKKKSKPQKGKSLSNLIDKYVKD